MCHFITLELKFAFDSLNFRRSTGLLFSLQSDKIYRKRGYGSLVLKALAKKVAELGNDSYGAVLEDNIPSRALFERLDFKVIGKVYFLRTKKQ